MSEAASANADQIAYWNDQAGRTWVELGELLDRQIEGVGLRGIEALAPRAGEQILDIGPGGGRTSLLIAERVGPQGRVVGVDISRPMLEIARRRAKAAGAANVAFVESDAQTYPFPPADFYGAFSRFGVMFFADPTAAFANILKALKPGGRLVFVCWRSLAENPWMTTPMAAAAGLLPPGPPALPEPGAPGPFAFADADRVRGILSGAGFSNIALTPVDMPIGGNSLDESLTLALRVGPLGARLRDNPQMAGPVREAVRKALEASLTNGKVWMPGAVWIVTARRP